MRHPDITRCLAKPVIPVIREISNQRDLLAGASALILQGGTVLELLRTLEELDAELRQKLHVLVHIDLISGLENNEAGLEFLASLQCVSGVVTVHHNLTRPASRLGMLSILRMFLTDSRAVERCLSVVSKSKPDAMEIMPTAAAARTANDFKKVPIPRIAGGLCRSAKDLQEALDSGIQAVTSTSPSLWECNFQHVQ